MDDARQVVDDAVADCLDRHVSDWGKMKNVIRDSLSDFMSVSYTHLDVYKRQALETAEVVWCD